MEKLSVVIPMYRSEKTIPFVVEELSEVMGSILSEYDYEIILVNDCGPDNVLSVAKGLAAQNRRIKVVELAKNVGQENAMSAGYTYASGDFVVSMDDDMQHPAKEIRTMLQVMKDQDLDVVLARFAHPQRSAFRQFGSTVNAWMAEIMLGKPRNIQTNSFFIMRKYVRDQVVKYTHTRPYIYGILFLVTDRVANVTMAHRSRLAGKSNYSLGPLLKIWFNGFFSFSNKPLRMVAMLGLCITLITALVAVGILISWMTSDAVEVRGWTSTILSIFFFSGMQMVGIGLVGEYLGRMYMTESRMPNFVVRHVTNLSTHREDPDLER